MYTGLYSIYYKSQLFTDSHSQRSRYGILLLSTLMPSVWCYSPPFWRYCLTTIFHPLYIAKYISVVHEQSKVMAKVLHSSSLCTNKGHTCYAENSLFKWLYGEWIDTPFIKSIGISDLLWRNREQVRSNQWNQQCLGYYIVSDNQLDQYCKIGKDMLFKEVIYNHSSILHTTSIKTCLLFKVRSSDKVM